MPLRLQKLQNTAHQYSLKEINGKNTPPPLYYTFVFDYDGSFCYGVIAKEYDFLTTKPKAIYKTFSGQEIEIALQDPINDPHLYSGLLSEGDDSDFGGSLLPPVNAMQYFSETDLDNILNVKDEDLQNLRIKKDHEQLNIIDASKDDANQDEWLIENVKNGNIDWGAYMLEDSTMYVVDIAHSAYKSSYNDSDFLGLNNKNMGNYMYGMAFQILGYSLSDASWFGSYYQLLNHGITDSLDDMMAISLGYEMAQKLYGAPKIKREIHETELMGKHISEWNTKREEKREADDE